MSRNQDTGGGAHGATSPITPYLYAEVLLPSPAFIAHHDSDSICNISGYRIRTSDDKTDLWKDSASWLIELLNFIIECDKKDHLLKEAGILLMMSLPLFA